MSLCFRIDSKKRRLMIGMIWQVRWVRRWWLYATATDWILLETKDSFCDVMIFETISLSFHWASRAASETRGTIGKMMNSRCRDEIKRERYRSNRVREN